MNTTRQMREPEYAVNLHALTPKQMTPAHTVYGKRLINDMEFIFFGQFVRCHRGSITIRGQWIRPDYAYRGSANELREETFKVNKCFLWGRSPPIKWNRCHWFKNVNQPAE